MMFTNPQRVEERVKATIGIHLVQLDLPHLEVKKGWEFIRFPFHYVNENAEVPNEFCLFDLPPNYTEKQFQEFCRRATQIKDAFFPSGKFGLEDLQEWTRKQGYIEVAKDKKGFYIVKSFLKPSDVKNR